MFLSSLGTGRAGVTELQAKLIFVQSSFGVAPPSPEYVKEPTLSIHDYLEALARLAEVVSLPSPEALRLGYKMDAVKKDPDPGFHLCDYVLNVSRKLAPSLSRSRRFLAI